MSKSVLFPTPECKPFASPGGVGVWASELTPELAARGVNATIVIPLHGGILPPGVSDKPLFAFRIAFNRQGERARIYHGKLPNAGVDVLFVENQTYFRSSAVYSYDTIPFETDTRKYAFFAKAVLELIIRIDPDIVHGSDWTAGYLFGGMELKNLAADAEGRSRPYRQQRVLTIHNIKYQGQTWKGRLAAEDFQDLADHPIIGPLFEDPRPEYHCVNPLRLAMELADSVNAVSPTNAIEITRPPDPDSFFVGGQGLEGIANRLMATGRLRGILNGTIYPEFKKEDVA